MDSHTGHLAVHKDNAAPSQRCSNTPYAAVLAVAGLAHDLRLTREAGADFGVEAGFRNPSRLRHPTHCLQESQQCPAFKVLIMILRATTTTIAGCKQSKLNSVAIQVTQERVVCSRAACSFQKSMQVWAGVQHLTLALSLACRRAPLVSGKRVTKAKHGWIAHFIGPLMLKCGFALSEASDSVADFRAAARPWQLHVLRSICHARPCA